LSLGHPNRERFLETFSVCFEKSSVCFCCFDTGPKHRNQPKQTKEKFFGFAKQTEKQPKQIEFQFVSVRTEKKTIVSRTPYPHIIWAAIPFLGYGHDPELN
jgi:hypothetical protein